MPFPNARHKVFTLHVAAIQTFFFKLAFHNDLRGDARVVGPRHPGRVVALHAVVAHERIHHRLVKGVAHVQDARDVGRGQLDAERGFGRILLAGKIAALFPGFIPALFNLRRFKALGKFFSTHFLFFHS